jgi:signal transduction histidine kinase
MFGKKYFIAAIGFILIALTVAHVLIFQNLSPLVVLEELYYIPIFVAALRFGLQGALLTYLFATLLYLPFFFGEWSLTYLDVIDRTLHLFFSGLFAFIAGFLIDRERRKERQAEQDRSLKGIGQAATAIVHDLKNPLITILGYAGRIRAKKGDPVQAAQVIFESAENMQRIVHDVLDFAKPVQLSRNKEDVRQIVRQAVDFCATKAKDAGVALTAEFPEQPMLIDVDRVQVQRALVNLINNGVEASDRGQRVAVSIVPGADSLSIVIRDQGPGMDGETVEAVFKPFYTRKSGGTGLGTSIAKKIIDSHDGRIIVDSRPGRGTTITVELPADTGMDGEREM